MGDNWVHIDELSSILDIKRTLAFELVQKYPLVTQPAPCTARNGKRPTLVLVDSLHNLPAKYLKHADLPPKPVSPVEGPEHPVIDSAWHYLSNEQKNQVSEKLDIIQPLLYADAKDRTDLAARIAASMGISTRTIFRWVQAWRDRNYKALCNTTRSDKGMSRTVSKEVQDTVKKLYLSKARYTALEVFNMAGPLAESRGERLSYSTVRRTIGTIPKATCAYYRETKKTFTDKFEVKIKRGKPDAINEFWCGDHHQLDIFVKNRNGKADRPWLTGWQDLCDMSITGYTLSFQGNALTIMQSFINGVAEKPEPDYPMCGVPQNVYVDNGKDYLSADFEALLNDLGVDMTNALPYRGSSKPIERFFRTLESQCISKLPGYCGSNPQKRPDDVTPLLTLDHLERIIRGYLVNRYHKETRRPLGKSCLARHADFAHVVRVTAPHEVLEVVAASRIPRKVTTQGVKYDNILYQHDALLSLIGETIEVRPVYKNKGEVICFHRGEYVCHAKDRELYGYHVTEEEYKAIAKEKKEQRRQIEEYYEMVSSGALIEDAREAAMQSKAEPVTVPEYQTAPMHLKKERKAAKVKREEEKPVERKPGKLYKFAADKEAAEKAASLK